MKAERTPRTRWLLAAAAVQAAVLPALGLPMFFRNEAGWHYLLWKEMPFLDLFRDFLTSRSSMSNAVASRPLVRALEWAQVHAFGLHASWYVVVNGLLFVLFALALFRLAWRLFGAGAAVLSVLLLMGTSQLVFYPVLNAIHGLQYPLEMALCTASLLVFSRVFAGETHRWPAGVLLAVAAFVSHAASAVVIPLCVAVMAWTSPALPPRTRRTIALLSPLAVSLVFALERAGIPGGLASQPGLAAKLEFAAAQLRVFGQQTSKLPGGLALLGAIALLLSEPLPALRNRTLLRVGGSLALAAVGWFLWRHAPLWGTLAMGAGLAAAVVRRRDCWFLAVWAALGVGFFVSTPEGNASYTRHFAVPAVLLMAAAFQRAFLAGEWVTRVRGRLTMLEWASIGSTAALIGITWTASVARVPMLSDKLEQVRYVRDLSLGFRAVLIDALAQVPQGGSMVFLRGPSRAEELESLYGAEYFARLQPAKSTHYAAFVALMGRPDVTVHVVAPDSLATRPGTVGVAVNPWEIEHLGPDATAVRVLSRGRARGAVFVTAP